MDREINKELVIIGINVFVPDLKEEIDRFIEPMKKFFYIKSIEPYVENTIKIKYTLVNSDDDLPDNLREYEKFIIQAIKRCTYFYKRKV